MLRTSLVVASALVLLFSAGCETTSGGGQMANSVYATHRIVRDLDSNLSGNVEKLNETAADLAAQVAENDRQARQLQSLSEENQVKLDALRAKLDELAATLYRHLNLTPPSDLGTSSVYPSEGTVQRGGIVVEQPAEATPPPAKTVEAKPIVEAAPVESLSPGDPANALADYQQIHSSYNAGDYERAVALCDAYLQRYPDAEFASRAQFWKAQAYLKMERFEDAVAAFETLRAKYPQSSKIPFSLRNQASIHLRLGQKEKAKVLLRELVENYPGDQAATADAAAKLKELEAM